MNEDIFKFLNAGSGQQDYQSNDQEELDKEKQNAYELKVMIALHF